jgi:hypothetical protein
VTAKAKLPRPQIVTLYNGKKRTFYRDWNGKFISAAKYRQWKLVETPVTRPKTIGARPSSEPSRKRQRSRGANSAKGALSANTTDSIRRHWTPLNNLIELDWDNYIRWTVSKPTLFKSKDKVRINDHDYEITPWNTLPDEHAALELSAKDRFIIVPIKQSEAATEKRSLLIQEEGTFDKGSLFMVDTEPPGDNAPFQRILIIGKEKDSAVGQEPDVIGLVKAVLTLDEPVRTPLSNPDQDLLDKISDRLRRVAVRRRIQELISTEQQRGQQVPFNEFTTRHFLSDG